MSDQITIKVLQQEHYLQYKGRRQKSLADGSLKAVNRLVGNGPAQSSQAGTPTKSFPVYQGTLADAAAQICGSIEAGYEPMLNQFASYDEPSARKAKKTFFSAVEAGKKELYDKYGSSIPGTEIDNLSSRLSSVTARVWYIQIITTRVSDTQFEGSRQRRTDGKWSASVKSMTIYRHEPLTQEQLAELAAVFAGLAKYEGTHMVGRLRKTDNSRYRAFMTPTGQILFKTDLKEDVVPHPLE